MVALRTIEPHRATVADAAGSERSARLTWHPDAERFTLTHWVGLVCVAQIEVSPEDASKLLAVLAEGVAGAMPRWLAADDFTPTDPALSDAPVVSSAAALSDTADR